LKNVLGDEVIKWNHDIYFIIKYDEYSSNMKERNGDKKRTGKEIKSKGIKGLKKNWNYAPHIPRNLFNKK
jgi:hypothetical protein